MKKILTLLLSLMLCFGFVVGCAGDKKDDAIKLKVWGSKDDQYMLGEMADEFKKQFPDKKFKIEFGVVGEPDCYARLSEDPAAGADVFMFVDDHMIPMTKAGLLYEITYKVEETIANNTPASVTAATMNGKLYAYPCTSDNTYFLYYNKQVVSDEQAKKMDDILAACKAAGKKFFMDLSNGWYNASFFLAAGCTIDIGEDGKQVVDFNNENGLKAALAMEAIAKHDAFMTGDDTVIKTGLSNNTLGAVVSGSWLAQFFEEAWGENMGVTKLPTVTMDGEQVQLKSFGGSKLCGVNALSKYPGYAMRLAEWFTNEQNQLKRFRDRRMGPSNINAANSDEVKNDKILSAVSEQFKYAVPQNNVLPSFWTPTEAFGNAIEQQNYGGKTLQQLLDEMVAQIQA